MDEQIAPQSRFFSIQDFKLHYLEWGAPEAPPLVMLHGGLDNAETWNELARGLARQWRVLALDLRGHGDSDWSSSGDYLPLSYLGDIARFMRGQSAWPCAIVAHSMGARLALQLAGAVPEAVSQIVAIEGVAAAAPVVEDLDSRMRGWLEDRSRRGLDSYPRQVGGWLRGRAEWEARPPRVHARLDDKIERQARDRKKGLGPAQARAFVESNMRRTEDGWIWKFDPLTRWQASNEPVTPQREFWSAIECPVLHVFGRDSWAYPPSDEDLSAFARGRHAVVPDAGHWVHLNQPELVFEVIRSFLHPRSAPD